MTTYTTNQLLTGTMTYELLADDILDVAGAEALTWDGIDSAITVVNNGEITDSADRALDSEATSTGTLLFTNMAGAFVGAEMRFKDLGLGATITIDNSGTMNGNGGNALEMSVEGATFIVTNQATGVMTNNDAGSDVINNASNLTLHNYGKIISKADTYDNNGPSRPAARPSISAKAPTTAFTITPAA